MVLAARIVDRRPVTIVGIWLFLMALFGGRIMAAENSARTPAQKAGAAALEKLAHEASNAAPVERWNPPFCGDIDMRIARDGAWFYQGTPILRPALVRLFSTILRKDPERYVLVTPVERVGIAVEDAPFAAVAMDVSGCGAKQSLRFQTNVGDWVSVGSEHPLRFERQASGGLKPYIHVRGGLWALATRALAIELVSLGETTAHEGAESFGVASAGTFFPIADIREFAAIEDGS